MNRAYTRHVGLGIAGALVTSTRDVARLSLWAAGMTTMDERMVTHRRPHGLTHTAMLAGFEDVAAPA